MCSRIVKPVLLALLGLGVCAAAPALAQDTKDKDLPKAEEILDRYVKATGGKEAHEKVKSRVIKGTMSVAGQAGKLTMYQKAPNLMLMEFELPGLGAIKSGTDGKTVWEMNPITGAKVLKGEKAEEMLRNADVAGDVNWKKHFKEVKTTGVEQVDGKPAYEVQMTSKAGGKQTRYFDKESGLLVRMKNRVDSPMGELEVVSDIEGYKKFGDLTYATKVRQSVLGQNIEMRVTDVEHNVDVPDDRFALPREVKDLLKDA
jgi:outer membrane lipoprotein-sorting protein